MKVSGILVIGVTTKLHSKIILDNTFRQNMKVSSMLVISVTSNLHGKEISENTFNPNIR